MPNNTINTIICSECGAVIEFPFDGHIYNGEHICDRCYQENFTHCDRCGSVERVEDTIYIEGHTYCEECVNRYFYRCDHCHEYTHRSYVYCVENEDGNTEHWCYDCRSNYAWTCEECGTTYSDDVSGRVIDDREYCHDCAERIERQSNIAYWKAPEGVRNYGYKPRACFCPAPDANTIFYGYELEMESHGNDCDETADLINETLGYTYCKHDGSLDDGLELVSHPATLQYHTNLKETYETLFKGLIDEGWRSHNDGTCGLHVHISRDPMERKNRYAVANLLLFFDYQWANLVKFSRRSADQLEKWAARYFTKNMAYKYLAECAKEDADRYVAVNLNNDHTVEIRMFRGTLNLETFIATLQLVDVLVNKAIELGEDFDAAKNISWNELVKSDHKELNAYLKKRGLLDIDEDRPPYDDDMWDEEPWPIEDEEPARRRINTNPEEHHGFRIGDRVALNITRSNDSYSWELRNRASEGPFYGTVMAFNSRSTNIPIGIMLDNTDISTHTLYGAIDEYRGQWCNPCHLSHLHPTEEDVGRTVRIDPDFHGVGSTARGLPGIMRGISGDTCAIEITVEWNGHDCSGHVANDSGYWVETEYVYLTEEV